MDRIKNYLRSEKEKIGEIEGTASKFLYIWTYYYLWILGIIAFIALLSFSIHQYFFTVNDNWFSITFANTRADVGNHSKLWEEYLSFTSYDTKEKNLVFEAQSYFDYTKDVTGNTYFEVFVAQTEAGTMDALTMEKESLLATGASGLLLDLESERCTSIREKYADRFVYCKPYDEDYGKEKVAVGIDISDSRLMTKYHIYAESCVIGICAYAEHLEAVEAFLDFVLSDD